MNDNNKGPNDPTEHEEEFGEEFDFEVGAEGDALEVEETEVQDQANPPQKKGGLLPLIIGIGVLGGIGWFAYNKFIAPKPTESVAQKETTESKPTQEQPKSSSIPSIAETPGAEGGLQGVLLDTQPLSSVEKKAKEVVTNEVLATLQKKIEEQDDAFKKQIVELQKNVESATQNLTNANKRVDTLQQQIATLSNSLQELTNEVKAIHVEQVQALSKIEEQAKVARAKAQPAAKPKQPEVAPTPTMTIHAIIPGRAWLRTADGKTLTVSEGDAIGEYGKIIKIDATNGVVVTSSGVVLR